MTAPHAYLVYNPEAGTRTPVWIVVQPRPQEPPSWPWMD